MSVGVGGIQAPVEPPPPSPPACAQSWLEFSGSTSAASVSQRVELGTLDYFNGTVGSGTGADGVSLEVQMALDIAGVPVALTLDFDFVLNNVPNDSNANSDIYELALPSADYVQLAESSKVTEIEVNGFYYQFILEFGSHRSCYLIGPNSRYR